MLWLWMACAPGLPETLSAPQLYGTWTLQGSAIGRALELAPADQDAGWDHAYQRLEIPSDEDPQVVEEGAWVLSDFVLSFNPDTVGAAPMDAQVLGFDGQVLVLEELGLTLRYELQ